LLEKRFVEIPKTFTVYVYKRILFIMREKGTLLVSSALEAVDFN